MSGPIGWLLSLVGSEIPRDPDPLAYHNDAARSGQIAAHNARRVIGTGRYRLGRGGRNPDSPSPLDASGLCDCSGFASWSIGLDRYQPGRIDGGWISTDAIVADATGPRRLFDLVAIGSAVLPGDLVVYPGRRVKGVRVAIGHVGVVVAVPAGWQYSATGQLVGLRVVHCAASRSPMGGAIRESDGGPWARRGVVARLRAANVTPRNG